MSFSGIIRATQSEGVDTLLSTPGNTGRTIYLHSCYDIIIDTNLKPWLIEVNASPSMAYTTPGDCVMKTSLINDVINIVMSPSGYPDVKWSKTPSKELLGKFDVLYDEELALADACAREVKSRTGHRSKFKTESKKPATWK